LNLRYAPQILKMSALDLCFACISIGLQVGYVLHEVLNALEEQSESV